MEQKFESTHEVNSKGRPAGGVSSLCVKPTEAANLKAIGSGRLPAIHIRWQDGPLGRGDRRIEANGAFVEAVIGVARGRLDFYQKSGFACAENQVAIDHLDAALAALNERTARREAAGVEGTHEIDPDAEPGEDLLAADG